MVLLARLSQEGEAVGHDHEDEHPPGQDRTHDGPLQEVETEQAGQAQQEHASSEVAESFSGFLGALDESEELEEIVSLRGEGGTMKR